MTPADLPPTMADKVEFLRKLPLLQNEAMRLGLYVTARAMTAPIRASGWEAAGERNKAAQGWSVEP